MLYFRAYTVSLSYGSNYETAKLLLSEATQKKGKAMRNRSDMTFSSASISALAEKIVVE